MFKGVEVVQAKGQKKGNFKLTNIRQLNPAQGSNDRGRAIKKYSRRSFTQKLVHCNTAALCGQTIGPLTGYLAGSVAGSLIKSQTVQAQTLHRPFLLHVYCSGGWDDTLVFNNLTGSPHVTSENGAQVLSGTDQISFIDHVSRPNVKAFFKSHGHRSLIVNGLLSGALGFKEAQRQHFGAPPSDSNFAVDWLTYYAANLNPVVSIPHAVIGSPFLPGQLHHSSRYITTEILEKIRSKSKSQGRFEPAAEHLLQKYRRGRGIKMLGGLHEASLDMEKMNAYQTNFSNHGRTEAALATALVQIEPSDDEFIDDGKLAIELFAQGLSQAATIQMGAHQAWDVGRHSRTKHSAMFDQLFLGLRELLATAEQRGILNQMTILVTSERGRAPLPDNNNEHGPWPYTSCLLVGDGLKGGEVIGNVDKFARGLPLDPLFGTLNSSNAVPLEIGHVMAALYLKSNVPVSVILPDHQPLATMLAA